MLVSKKAKNNPVYEVNQRFIANHSEQHQSEYDCACD